MDPFHKTVELLHLIHDMGGHARIVGGAVRDRLLGIIPHDYDIACDLTPEELIKACDSRGLRTIPTGIDFGTVTVLFEETPYEITSLRADVRTDGRHAEVVYSKSFEEDAKRRDFTINAMYEDRDGIIYDFFGGKQDLKDSRIRFVGDAETRIKEDFLRILRFFRFKARFNLKSNSKTLDAIKTHSESLAKISQERIYQEMNGFFKSEKIASCLQEMSDTGVLKIIFDGLNLNSDQFKKIEETTQKVSFDPYILRVAALYHIDKKNCQDEKKLTDLLLKKKNPKDGAIKISALVCSPFDKMKDEDQAFLMGAIDDLEKKLGKDQFLGVFVPFHRFLNSKDLSPSFQKAAQLETNKKELRTREMPLKTSQIIKHLSLEPGPLVGMINRKLLMGFRNEEWSTHDEGLAYATKLLSDSPELKS